MHEDSGKYSVEITNEFGSDKKFTFITVKGMTCFCQNSKLWLN